MKHFFGIILRGSDKEIVEDDGLGKKSYMGQLVAITEGRQRMMENPNIKQLNVYRGIQEISGLQGPRMLVHHLIREGNFIYG